MARAAGTSGANLTVVTSRSKLLINDIPIKNFAPVGEFEIPEYELQKLSFPPFLDMLDYVQREGFTELIISTPGPIGLCALGCAKLLGLRTLGHLSHRLPAIRRASSATIRSWETLVWNYMQWFYGPGRHGLRQLRVLPPPLGRSRIAPEKLRIFPRGLDTELFNPKHRDEKILDPAGREGAGAALCRTHLARKGFAAAGRDHARAAPADGESRSPLAIVGEGPYRAELEKKLPGAIFTGILTGRELGVAYASADLFVFPSTNRHLRQRGGRGDGGPACPRRCPTSAARASW